jgi:hypothetical protein
MYDDQPMTPEDKRVSLMRKFVDLSDSLDRVRAEQRELDDRQMGLTKERESMRRELISIIEPSEKVVAEPTPAVTGYMR